LNKSGFFLSDAIDAIQEVLDHGGEFRLYPKGRSMLPLIRQERDSVLLKKRTDTPDAPLRKHEIAFYRRDNGQFVLHRVMRIEQDGTYTMCGDNQFYLEKNIRSDQIIAYVAQIYKQDKPLMLSSFRYRLYVRVWSWMPFRYCAKFPARAMGWIRRKLKKKEIPK
jgi:hypothetical protein